MRKLEKIVLWPVYFDLNKTRSEGRRVPKKLATPAPRLEEVRKAAELLGFRPETVPDAAHPSFSRQKTGLLILPKRGAKAQIARKIAKKILELKSGS